MLILNRRTGESLIIETPTNERAQITMLGQNGNQVRVGIAAPDDMVILRKELTLRELAALTD